MRGLVGNLLESVSTTSLTSQQRARARAFAIDHLGKPDYPDSEHENATARSQSLARSLEIRGAPARSRRILELSDRLATCHSLELLHILLENSNAPLSPSCVTQAVETYHPRQEVPEAEVQPLDEDEYQRQRAQTLLAECLPSDDDIALQFHDPSFSVDDEEEEELEEESIRDDLPSSTAQLEPESNTPKRLKQRPPPQQLPLSWLVTEDPDTATARKYAANATATSDSQRQRQQLSIPVASCLSSASHGFQVAAEVEREADKFCRLEGCAVVNAVGESVAQRAREWAAAAARSAWPTAIASEEAGMTLQKNCELLRCITSDVSRCISDSMQSADRTASIVDALHTHTQHERSPALSIMLDGCTPLVRSLTRLISDGSLRDDPNGELCVHEEPSQDEGLALTTGTRKQPLIPAFLASIHADLLAAARASRLLRRAGETVPHAPAHLLPRQRSNAPEALCVMQRRPAAVYDRAYEMPKQESDKAGLDRELNTNVDTYPANQSQRSWIDSVFFSSHVDGSLGLERGLPEEAKDTSSLTALEATHLLVESSMPRQSIPRPSKYFLDQSEPLRKLNEHNEWREWHQWDDEYDNTSSLPRRAKLAGKPADHALDSSIVAPLRTWCARVQAATLDALLRKHCLMNELRKLRQLFLGSDSDVVDMLVSASSRIDKDSVSERELRDLGVSLLERVGITTHARVRVGVGAQPKHSAGAERTALCVNGLNDVGWPLDTVLRDRHTSRSYSRAQAALVEIRQARYDLDRTLMYTDSIALREAAHTARVCTQHLAYGMMDVWGRFEHRMNTQVDSVPSLRSAHDHLADEALRRARELERAGALEVARLGSKHAQRLSVQGSSSDKRVSSAASEEGDALRKMYAELCFTMRSLPEKNRLRTLLLFNNSTP